MGGSLWTGTQMTNVAQAMDLRTHRGVHQFGIQFTASKQSLASRTGWPNAGQLESKICLKQTTMRRSRLEAMAL